MKRLSISLFFLGIIFQSSLGQFDPHYQPNRTGIVHLFEWRWSDIARECEEFLGPNGYGGVQVSPVNENAVLSGHPWFERYQPISYNLTTRSGTKEELQDMIKRCNNVGVRIYVDVVFNHMAAGAPVNGTAGSFADPDNRSFPNFDPEDFHESCPINNYMSPFEVRACELSGLPDLDQSKPHVRQTILNFLNELIDLGVAGFRVDACKHMFVEDLSYIYGNLKNLPQDQGFGVDSRPFIFQEVIDVGGEGVSKMGYIDIGTVTEFIFSSEIGLVFQGEHTINNLEGFGPARTFLPSNRALIFVDNHDNQRGHGGGGIVLTHKKPKQYTSAVAFMLANDYGIPRVMSSYYFDDASQGPPQDKQGRIVGPKINHSDGSCFNGWVCEHRWNGIKNMIQFRIAAESTPVTNWKVFGNHELSFCRGNVGCIAFNTGTTDAQLTIPTSLAPGKYCDIITGNKVNGKCTGLEIKIDSNGNANVNIQVDASQSVVAFYSDSKI